MAVLKSALVLALVGAAASQQLLTDLSLISRQWGQISVYQDNPADYFGVKDTGLPDACQVEQAHLLQRHAQRFPTSGSDDGKSLHAWHSAPTSHFS